METNSPYSPPKQTDDPMLTAFQKACLRNVLRRRQNPSKIRFILCQWPAAVAHAVTAVAMFVPVYASVDSRLLIYLTGAFALGFFTASIAGILGECLRQFRVWPAVDRVINWEELKRMVE